MNLITEYYITILKCIIDLFMNLIYKQKKRLYNFEINHLIFNMAYL